MKLYEKMNSGVYVLAEVSANHAGKIENAFKIIEEAAKAGADCVKIQTYTADTLTIDCREEPYQIKGGLWDGYNYYQLYQAAYTPWEWQRALRDKCREVGVDFLSTPFDRTAVDFLEDLDVEFYKIASFELVDIPLIEYTASKGKPMIMSCGMASEEEIREALEAASLTEMVAELPDGLDTRTGDGGSLFSGGQKQRISIARAFLRNAPILIMDEATSALDSKTEKHVSEAMGRLRSGRTCLVVAHRLSTIADADRIVVMKDGCIIEIGSYNELMAAQGAFARLVELQTA